MTGPRSRSGEIVSPVLGYDDIELLQQIVRAVRAAGARVDETCGIHVHVGAHHFLPWGTYSRMTRFDELFHR